jgi:hypothetical protein
MGIVDIKGRYVNAFRWDQKNPRKIWTLLLDLSDKLSLIYLEDVNLPRKPGKIEEKYSASGGLAVNFGIWQGFLIALNIPYVLVHPSSWQAVYGIYHWKKLQAKGQPAKSPLDLARDYFLDASLEFQADSGIAVGLLLAKLAAHDATRGLDRGALREVRQESPRRRKRPPGPSKRPRPPFYGSGGLRVQ